MSLKAIWTYFKYIVRHKWFVFKAGYMIGVPIWRLIVHDLSKLRPDEFFPYALYFYGDKPKDIVEWSCYYSPIVLETAEAVQRKRQSQFDKAWLHHQNRNDHHWQYWVLINDQGEIVRTGSSMFPTLFRMLSSETCLEMPEECVLEMVADWAGAGRAIHGRYDLASWYLKNKDNIVLHPKSRALVEKVIKELENTLLQYVND